MRHACGKQSSLLEAGESVRKEEVPIMDNPVQTASTDTKKLITKG
jgi:hypothetical protein